MVERELHPLSQVHLSHTQAVAVVLYGGKTAADRGGQVGQVAVVTRLNLLAQQVVQAQQIQVVEEAEAGVTLVVLEEQEARVL